MKKQFTICFLAVVFCLGSNAQKYTAFDIIKASGQSVERFNEWVKKNNFTPVLSDVKGELNYSYQPGKKSKDRTRREITFFSKEKNLCFSYKTFSEKEFTEMLAKLGNAGFKGNTQKKILEQEPIFLQKNNLSLYISATRVDSAKQYAFVLRKFTLPNEIQYAEDLLQFNSHEMLSYYFGERNVIKDFYYFQDNEISKCSVLFPHTARQAIFIWGDEENNFQLQKLYIGGNLKPTQEKQENTIGQNLWRSKSGLQAGMSVYQLRMLNGADFNIGGGKSVYTGLVFGNGEGKINFEKENIILGCINCYDDVFAQASLVNSDDAIREQRIMFIQTIILEPFDETELGITQRAF